MRELTSSKDFGGTNVTCVHIEEETKKHYHNKMIEFYIILNGELELELDDKVEKCGKDTLIMIEPKTKHKARGNADVLVICSPAFDPDDEIVVE